MKKFFVLSVVLLFTLALTAGIVSAAHIAISDDDINGVVVIPDANFEFGFSQTQLGFKYVEFTGSWFANVGANGSGIIYFVEPGTTNLSGILDVSFTSTNPGGFGIATINGRFETDQCGVLLSGRSIPLDFPTVDEQDAPVGVNGLFRDPVTGLPVSLPSNITISVDNDLVMEDCAEIDIKPGSCPNPLNPQSEGSVPVAIVGTPDFDVNTVDPSTITLAGISMNGIVEIVDSTEPYESNPDAEECEDCFDADTNLNCDLDGDGIDDAYCGDGYDDLVVKFDTQDLLGAIGAVPPEGCIELVLMAKTTAGGIIIGRDSMIVKKGIKAAPDVHNVTTTWGDIKDR